MDPVQELARVRVQELVQVQLLLQEVVVVAVLPFSLEQAQKQLEELSGFVPPLFLEVLLMK